MGITLNIYITQIVEVLALAIGFYTLRNLPYKFKLLLVYISISTFTNLTMYTLSDLFRNNYFLIHFYTIIEFILIIIIVFSFINGKHKQIIRLIIILLFLLFSILIKLTFEPISMMDNYSSSLANSIIVLLASYVLLMHVIDTSNKLSLDPVMIILCGILIYFGGSLFIQALSNLIFIQEHEVASLLWGIHNVLHIIFDIICIYVFLLVEKSTLTVKKNIKLTTSSDR